MRRLLVTDLLYQPVVLVCGHVTCFWCCHQSMDMRGQSHCPLCRHPYHHFPAICRMLDDLLKKMYPISYDKRKTQALEDQEQISFGYSPDLDQKLEHSNVADQPCHNNFEDTLSVNPSLTEENNSDGASSSGNCKLVTVADVLCAACKQLLFHPVALNCGHVYCEACITVQEDGVIKCQVCECRHPSGFPKVCKEIDHVLEEQFPSEYALRRSSTQLSQQQIRIVNSFKDQGTKFSYPTDENFLQWWASNGSKFHAGVGCDMCGMCPIIGERYRCKDCIEKCGYDLCGDCHNSDIKIPGRFNQKHTPQHQFELIKPSINQGVIFRLLSGQLAIVSAASRHESNSANGNSEFASSSLVDHNGDDDADSAAFHDHNDGDDDNDDSDGDDGDGDGDDDDGAGVV
ncbi:E3 ubiquitin-protein ligase PRT1-like isoform X2 [Rutidosis leptorrhynchoides]|uniref:E3 ubiquitin-protein ligase PRT1-like isoform X2 n=1 Tax=Rutidosis leptorrhynchoides TaxID=125765 RepID=UPI003A9A54D1